jgi:hypothetical protein
MNQNPMNRIKAFSLLVGELWTKIDVYVNRKQQRFKHSLEEKNYKFE